MTVLDLLNFKRIHISKTLICYFFYFGDDEGSYLYLNNIEFIIKLNEKKVAHKSLKDLK